MNIAKISVVFTSSPDETLVYIITSDINKDMKVINDTKWLHVDKPLAKRALEAYMRGNNSFTLPNKHGEESVSLLEVTKLKGFDKYAEKIADGTVHILKSGQKTLPVFLYKTTCRCYSCYRKQGFNDIISVKANVENVYGYYYMIEVEYCKNCKRYFISEMQLAQYENNFGTFMFSRTFQSDDPEAQTNSYDFAPDSILSRHGYYVSQAKNPGDKRRREILWMLLHNKIATKGEIKEILSNFIALRSESQFRAKAIWRADLRFVMELDADAIEANTFLYIRKR